ncbi:valine--tRNA ligase [Maricaulis sp. W15]|uniref:valine--tRNA ligase n=1 Tax=Maricaulis sp. W15 TaxID=1772333 RepID=UPI000948B4A1|nr:valine--tRNA ligase [Maricaulis sp. W15]
MRTLMEKTFNPTDAETRIYQAWEDSGAFQPKDDDNAEAFSIVIPPPNVTGRLHIGHALNNTLQDVLVRYKRMLGCSVLWQPGTDHAGIATQMVVERQLADEGNISRRDMGREAFIKRVWEWKEESGGAIMQQLRRLGATCDWSRERFTLDEGLSKAVLKVFVELHQQGLIYRDKRLVNWDPHFQTAISDLEVENRETQGHFWHFAYPLADGSGELVVATTRPETVLGDSAVAVHPEDERYQHLIGKMIKLPIADVEIPIVADEHADPEQGTGCVKITPAHDFNDFEVGKRHDLPKVNILDRQARLLSEDDGTGGLDRIPAEWRGMDRFEARKKLVAKMDELGLLRAVEDKVIQQPYGDRSGVVIEPWLTDQWYVNAGELAKDAIAAVEDGRTTFHPKTWEKTYFEWMRNIQPWCISRQLWWGHRVPAWYLPGRGEDGVAATKDDTSARETIYCEESFEDVVAKIKAQYGVDEVVEVSDEFGAPDYCNRWDAAISNATLDQNTMFVYRDPDVLDTWFSSALWPFSTLGWPDDTPEMVERFYPTSVLITAFDIIFFWVARMMMQGLHFMKVAPFKDVYIHALVRDEKGQKMSKSKGNVIDPLELIDEYGADAVRFTLAAQAGQGRDIRMSKERVEGYRNFSTKLWNAARFAEMNECVVPEGFDPKSVTQTVNKWILSEAAQAVEAINASLDTYRFNDAAAAAYRFVWNVFCDWHLEFAKPLFNGEDEAAKAETRATTAYVLDQALKMLHPFMPFVTEELWQQTGQRETQLIIADWPQLDGLQNVDATAEMDWLINLITDIRRLRAEMNIPAGAKLPLVAVGADAEVADRLARHDALIQRMARLSEVSMADAVPPASAQTVLGTTTLALPLEGVIDFGAEKDRLAKEVAKLDGEIGRLEKKLGNERFVANAPESVVAEQREKLTDYAGQKAKMAEALARLEAM